MFQRQVVPIETAEIRYASDGPLSAVIRDELVEITHNGTDSYSVLKIPLELVHDLCVLTAAVQSEDDPE